LVLEKLEGQRISTRSVRGIKFPERRRVCLDPFRRFTDGSGYAILAMAWGWGHGTTVCVVLSAAEREQLAAIVADCNRPRKHGERAPHRGCLGRSALGAAGGAKHRRQSADGVAVATTLRRESGVEGLLRDKTRKPGKAPIAAETTARVVGADMRRTAAPGDPLDGRAMAKAIGISLGSGQRILLSVTNRSRTACAPSSARTTPVSSPNRATSPGSEPARGPATSRTRGSIRRPMRWCCRLTKRARSKHSTGPS
jgi:hypothetical protein